MADRTPALRGYVRASTIEQIETLEVQEAQIRNEYALRYAAQGYAFGGIYIDQGVSGAKPFGSRPASVRLLADAEEGDLIVVTKLDRGFRSLKDLLHSLENMDRRGLRLVLMDLNIDTATPTGRLMLSVFGAFAEFERARISQRTKEVLAMRRLKGWVPVGCPLGFKWIGERGRRKVVPCEYTQGIMRRIKEWVDEGWTFDQIYFHLLRLKVRTRKGTAWSRSGIHRAYSAACHLPPPVAPPPEQEEPK
jgi:DNA invertase Pin-like site-specific DNA recombinase